MDRNTHHVVPDPKGGWSVKKGGAVRASRHFARKSDAESWGRKVSTEQGSDLVIHKRDGTIQRKDSYAAAPRPLHHPHG
jgi:hypothetical protein